MSSADTVLSLEVTETTVDNADTYIEEPAPKKRRSYNDVRSFREGSEIVIFYSEGPPEYLRKISPALCKKAVGCWEGIIYKPRERMSYSRLYSDQKVFEKMLHNDFEERYIIGRTIMEPRFHR